MFKIIVHGTCELDVKIFKIVAEYICKTNIFDFTPYMSLFRKKHITVIMFNNVHM